MLLKISVDVGIESRTLAITLVLGMLSEEVTVQYDHLDFKVIFRIFPVLIAAFSGPLFGSGYLTIFGYVQEDFGISLFLIGFSITFYAVPFTIGQLFSAGLADLTNRRMMLRLGSLSFALGSFINAMSGDYFIFLLGRIIQGASVAILMPVVMSSLADSVTDDIRGKMLGLYGTTTALGVFLGPIVAGTINALAGWRMYFIFSGLYGLTEFVLLFFGVIRESSLGMKGNILQKLKKSAWDTISVGKNFHLVVVAVLGFLGFMYLITLISYTSKGLQLLNMPSEQIGMAVSAYGFAGIAFASPGGWVVDKVGRKRTILLGTIGLILTAAAAASYVTLVIPPLPIIIALLMFSFGMTIAFYWAGLNTLATELIPEKRGASTSFYSFFRNLGQVVAPLIFEPLFSRGGLSFIYASGMVIFSFSALIILVFPVQASHLD